MGGVGEELALLLPGLFHRSGGPAGQHDGDGQQQEKGGHGDLDVGAHHLLKGGLLHGGVHEGDLLEQAVVLPEVAQVIGAQGPLLLLLGQALLQHGAQLLGPLEVAVRAARDIGGIIAAVVLPEHHGEVWQHHFLAADVQPQVRLLGGHGPVAGVFPDHPLEHLVAEDLQILPGGEEDGHQHHAQHHHDQRHADHHEFQLQFADHPHTSFR